MGKLWHQPAWLSLALLSARVLAVPSDPMITPGPKLVRRENAIVGYSSDPLSGCELPLNIKQRADTDKDQGNHVAAMWATIAALMGLAIAARIPIAIS